MLKRTGIFMAAAIIFMTGAAYAATADLPETGQTTCYDTAGDVISCATTGQDGDLKKGVAWPNPRFTLNTDTTVTDNLTGFIWTPDGGTPTVGPCAGGTKVWQAALDYVACLNTNSFLGHSDWRLPNVNELESLINAKETNSSTWLNDQEFSNVQAYNYWSSTTHASNTGSAWVVDMWYGYVNYDSKSYNYYAWPVRSGQ